MRRVVEEMQSGELTRVEPNDVDYPMIVNDQRVTLPAIHLTGTFEIDGKDPRPASERPSHIGAELFVLDDAPDPLVLSWRLRHPTFHAGNFRVEVVKIDFPVVKPENLLEKQLTQEKRAVISISRSGAHWQSNKRWSRSTTLPRIGWPTRGLARLVRWKATTRWKA